MLQLSRPVFLISSWVVAVLASASVYAHHTWVAEYDRDDIVILEGRISEVNLTSPHSRIFIEVDVADGTQVWAGETWPLPGLYRRGLTINSLNEGDGVRVTGERARNGRPGLHLRSIYRPADNWRVWIGLRDDTGENTATGIGEGISVIQLEEEDL